MKELSIRTMKYSCGLLVDRYYNAAINIINEGLRFSEASKPLQQGSNCPNLCLRTPLYVQLKQEALTSISGEQFTRDNLDIYLRGLAKEFRQINGKKIYLTCSNIISIHAVSLEYLIAMKLMSLSNYKADMLRL